MNHREREREIGRGRGRRGVVGTKAREVVGRGLGGGEVEKVGTREKERDGGREREKARGRERERPHVKGRSVVAVWSVQPSACVSRLSSSQETLRVLWLW